MKSKITQAEVQDFLFHEAELLDEWKLNEWLALFTDDARYLVPSTDLPEDASPDVSLFYIADDRFRLGERVSRLNKKTAHSEFPRSKTRHLVSNVRLRDTGDGELKVTAAFVTYRSKNGITDTYIGGSYYSLAQTADGLKIREKKCVLDLDGLRPQGRISIIL